MSGRVHGASALNGRALQYPCSTGIQSGGEIYVLCRPYLRYGCALPKLEVASSNLVRRFVGTATDDFEDVVGPSQ